MKISIKISIAIESRSKSKEIQTLHDEAAVDMLLHSAEQTSIVAELKSTLLNVQEKLNRYEEEKKETENVSSIDNESSTDTTGQDGAAIRKELNALKLLLSDDALERQATSAMEFMNLRNNYEQMKKEYATAQHMYEMKEQERMVLSSKYHNVLQDKQNVLDEQVDDEVVAVMMSAVPTASSFASPRVENIHVELERSLPPTPVQDDGEEDDADDEEGAEGAEGDKEQNEYNWDSKVVDILLGGSRTGSRTPVQEEDEGNDDDDCNYTTTTTTTTNNNNMLLEHTPQPPPAPVPMAQNILPLPLPSYLRNQRGRGGLPTVSPAPSSNGTGATDSTFDGTPTHASDVLDMSIASHTAPTRQRQPTATPIPSTPVTPMPSNFYPMQYPQSIPSTISDIPDCLDVPEPVEGKEDVLSANTNPFEINPTIEQQKTATATTTGTNTTKMPDTHQDTTDEVVTGGIGNGIANNGEGGSNSSSNNNNNLNDTGTPNLSLMEWSKIDHQHGNETLHGEYEGFLGNNNNNNNNNRGEDNITSPTTSSPALSLSSLYSPSSMQSAPQGTKLFVDIDTDVGTTETIGVTSYKDLDDCMVVFSRKYGLTNEAKNSLHEYLGDLLAQHLAIEAENDTWTRNDRLM